MKSIYPVFRFRGYLALLLIFVLTSCLGSVRKGPTVLAIVNGYPITEADLIYALEIEHRREDLSKAGKIRIRDYVNRLIDERLLVEEAERMGIDKEPWLREKLRAFMVRESVTQLYQDEIASKVKVTEEEARDFYRRNYVVYKIGIIDVPTEKDALKALQEIKDGKDFAEVVNRYSAFKSMNRGGVKYTRRALSRSPEFERIVLALKPGEVSRVHKINNRYYIVKLIEVIKPRMEDFEKKKKAIMRTLRKDKEGALAEKYLKKLKEKVKIKVDKDLLAYIEKDREKKELEHDRRTLAMVNGYTLRVSDFIKQIKELKKPEKLDRLLQRWVDTKVVDVEALSRKYYERSPLKEKLQSYKEQLMRRVFIGTTIVPDIKVDEEALRNYYMKHKDRYRTPAEYKLQRIVLKDRKEAEEVIEELRAGADFSWVAMNRSRGSNARRGGMLNWMQKSMMPEEIQDVIDKLEPGQISPIIKGKDSFIIVKLLDIRGREPRPFEQVKSIVYEQYMNEMVSKKVKEFVKRLRADAQIEVMEDNIRRLQERFR